MPGVVRAVVVAALLAAATVSAPTAASAEPSVVERRVVFSVDNVNRSEVPCASDGQPYEVAATVVGPAEVLDGDRAAAATLYVHGLGLTSYYWHFTPDRSLSHAVRMARLGHVSVVYDRLGYGDGPRPGGMETCYGSDADVAAQLVQGLKTGDYTALDDRPVRFDAVAVAGHSQAGLVVQPMAYSFDAADALIVTSWTDDGNRPQVAAEAAATAQDCLASAPELYAKYPRDDETFRAFYFHAAAEDVAAAATALREPDPCGDGASLPQTLTADRAGLPRVTLPVLLVYGEHDGYRDAAAGLAHADRFTGSDDVTVHVLRGAGNAFVLEPAGDDFAAMTAQWLCARQLAPAAACAEGVGSPGPSARGVPATDPPGVLAATALPRTGGAPPALAVLALIAALALAGRFRARAQGDVALDG